MTIQDLVYKDKSFNSEIFISKTNNMIKRLLTAVTLNELDKVDHFISDNVYNKFLNEMEKAKTNGCRLFYDEVNVSSYIKDISEESGVYKIWVNADCKYLKYSISNATGAIVSGSDHNKVNIIHKVILKKKVNNTDMTTNRCRGCGMTYSVNYSGVCPNCGRIYDLEEIDYYIDMFE